MENTRNRFRRFCKEKFQANKFDEKYKEPFLVYKEELISMIYALKINARANRKDLIKSLVRGSLKIIKNFFNSNLYEFKAAYGYKAESFIEGREYITEVLRELCDSEKLIQGQIGRITDLEEARKRYLDFCRSMIKSQKFESYYEKPIDEYYKLILSLIDEYLQYKERDIFTEDNRQLLETEIISALEYLQKMFDDARIKFSGENLRRVLQK